MSEPGKVRLVGTVATVRVADVSKRAGVEKLKSYLDVEVESVEPAELRDRLGERVQLIADGKLAVAAGTRVEIETYVSSGAPGRLPIYKLTAR